MTTFYSIPGCIRKVSKVIYDDSTITEFICGGDKIGEHEK